MVNTDRGDEVFEHNTTHNVLHFKINSCVLRAASRIPFIVNLARFIDKVSEAAQSAKMWIKSVFFWSFLTTAATVLASPATLNQLPRVTIHHTVQFRFKPDVSDDVKLAVRCSLTYLFPAFLF